MKIRRASLIVLAALCLSIVSRTTFIHAQDASNLIARRVLLISIDGLHRLGSGELRSVASQVNARPVEFHRHHLYASSHIKTFQFVSRFACIGHRRLSQFDRRLV